MYINVYSDLICPCCFVRERQLDHVLARFIAWARELKPEAQR